MPAFRARPVVAALVVSLASTACGGGEDIAQVENENTSPPVLSEASLSPVPVGDRFDWCADLAEGWAEYDALLAAAQVAEQEMWAAIDAMAVALDSGDDLDVAEARQARDEAIERNGAAVRAFWDAVVEADHEVLNAYRLATGQRHTDDETFTVAAGRAWEAFLEHSPETKAAAAEGKTSESDQHHPLRDEINAAIQDGNSYDAYRESFSESCASRTPGSS